MVRRDFLVARAAALPAASVAVLALVACAPQQAETAAAAKDSGRGAASATPVELPVRRSIVLLTIDTLRADHLGCYGYVRATSPRIDALAARGVLFEQAAVQWPKTGPSMASLLSSTYGSTSGVARQTMQDKVPSSYDLLAEVLRGAGYQTLGVVSNGSLSPDFQFDQGFDRFQVEQVAHAANVTDQALALIEQRDPSRPCFLWVHYVDPHAPYQPGAGFGREYADFVGDYVWKADQRPDLPVDPRVADPAAKFAHGDDIGKIPLYAYLQGKRRLRDYVAQYDGEIRFLDEHVGRLVDGLASRGDLEGALLVLTADHGESLGDHDHYFVHGRLPYDDCVRVPLIVVHPGWAPARIRSPVGLIDVAPTLLDLVGVPAGWQFEGQSLLGWLRAGALETSARPVFTESGYLKEFDVSIRKGRWKLIKVGTKYMASLLTRRPYELYDVLADPGETRNLVDERSDVFDELKAELDDQVATAYARVPPPTGGEADLSPEQLEQQRALGYADDKTRQEHDDSEPHDDDGGR